jgi:hypothetical protein
VFMKMRKVYTPSIITRYSVCVSAIVCLVGALINPDCTDPAVWYCNPRLVVILCSNCVHLSVPCVGAPSQQQRIQQIAIKVKDLPTPNYCTLKALIIHLRK